MAEDVEELVKRLRGLLRRAPPQYTGGLQGYAAAAMVDRDTINQAADTLESLRASITRVEEERDEAVKALEPFAQEAEVWGAYEGTLALCDPEGDVSPFNVTMADVRRVADVHARLSRPTSAEGK